jgi:LacI family transcriptional regulator
LRLADGCVLLGRSLDRDELARLVAEGLPFVSIGRRDDAGGPVPYVGADYAGAVSALVERAVLLGHRKLAYLGNGGPAESWADRLHGFTTSTASLGVHGIHLAPNPNPTSPVPSGAVGATTAVAAGPGTAAGAAVAAGPGTAAGAATRSEPEEPKPQASAASRRREARAEASAAAQAWLQWLVAQGVTAVFAEDHGDGVALHLAAQRSGVELSVATLGEAMRAASDSDVEFSGFRIPRQRMGAEAMDVLTALMEGTPTQTQRLLACELVEGETLVERK